MKIPDYVKENYKVILISTSFYLFYCVLFFNLTIDDSYISLRYARNLKNGFGLTWNPNGEKVEGYSNFLWIIIEFMLFFFSEDPLFLVKTIGIIFGLFTLFIILKISHQTIKTRSFRNKPMLMISILPAWGYYAVSGLETMMFITFLLEGYYYFNKYKKTTRTNDLCICSFFFLLVSLTRIDGFIFIVGIFGIDLILNIKNRKKIKDLILSFCIFLAPYLIYTLWRLNYYGSILPNTYYAKTIIEISDLFHLKFYNKYYLVALKFIPFLLIIALINLKSHPNKKDLYPIIFTSIIFGASIILTTNWMPFYRRYLPILIILFILCDPTPIVEWLKTRILFIKNKNFEFVNILVIFIPLIAIYVPINFRNYNIYEEKHLIFPERFIYPNMDGLQKMGKWMNANIDQNKSVALGDVGTIGYYFKGVIIDMWGLNSLDIAREIEEYNDYKDEDFVNSILEKEPNYIILKAFEKYQNNTDIYFKRYLRPLFLENNDFINNYTMIHYQDWKESAYYIIYKLK